MEKKKVINEYTKNENERMSENKNETQIKGMRQEHMYH